MPAARPVIIAQNHLISMSKESTTTSAKTASRIAEAKMPRRSAHKSWPKSACSLARTTKVPRIAATIPAPANISGKTALSASQATAAPAVPAVAKAMAAMIELT